MVIHSSMGDRIAFLPNTIQKNCTFINNLTEKGNYRFFGGGGASLHYVAQSGQNLGT